MFRLVVGESLWQGFSEKIPALLQDLESKRLYKHDKLVFSTALPRGDTFNRG